MTDGPKSSFQGLSEPPIQHAVAPNAAEQWGSICKRLLLVDFCAKIFIGVVCGKFGINDGWSEKLFLRAFRITNPTRRSP